MLHGKTFTAIDVQGIGVDFKPNDLEYVKHVRKYVDVNHRSTHPGHRIRVTGRGLERFVPVAINNREALGLLRRD